MYRRSLNELETMTQMNAKKDPKPGLVAKYEECGRSMNLRLGTLESSLSKEDPKVNAEFNMRRAKLMHKIDLAHKKLVEFKSEGSGVWYNFKTDLEMLWKDIDLMYRGLALLSANPLVPS